MDFRSMCSFINTLSGCELVTLALLIAISISQNLNNDDVNILGNFFSAIGSNLSTIASSNESI